MRSAEVDDEDIGVSENGATAPTPQMLGAGEFLTRGCEPRQPQHQQFVQQQPQSSAGHPAATAMASPERLKTGSLVATTLEMAGHGGPAQLLGVSASKQGLDVIDLATVMNQPDVSAARPAKEMENATAIDFSERQASQVEQSKRPVAGVEEGEGDWRVAPAVLGRAQGHEPIQSFRLDDIDMD